MLSTYVQIVVWKVHKSLKNLLMRNNNNVWGKKGKTETIQNLNNKGF